MAKKAVALGILVFVLLLQGTMVVVIVVVTVVVVGEITSEDIVVVFEDNMRGDENRGVNGGIW